MRLLACLLLVWVCAFAPGLATEPDDPGSPYIELELFARALQLVRQDYLDESKVSYKDLVHRALEGMLEDLDPHSQFLEPKNFKTMQEETRSEFGGLGVVVSKKAGLLTVVNPIEDTPGFRAGLLPGDQILKIDGLSTGKTPLADSIEKLRGDVGGKVTLTIRRPSTAEVFDLTLVREIIKVPSVKEARILPARPPSNLRIGYVRITQFSEPTASELAEALDRLEEEGMQALVLDLRFNPGGLLHSAVDVCGEFLPPNTLVVSTEGRHEVREYRTRKNTTASRGFPLVVLANHASASGSEIVAGALKDLDRALVVGETTFGKGSVQSVLALPDGSAARLTTAHYLTPGRNPIHGHGVPPHITLPIEAEDEIRILESRRRRESPGGNETFEWDRQVECAVDVLQAGRLHQARLAQ
jgi:carboxyl-terminal processing protease